MSVTILNVDPGGCRPSRPMPATARICPVDGLHRDDPAELAAERAHGGALHRRGRPCCGRPRRCGVAARARRRRAGPCRPPPAARPRACPAGGRRAPARGRSAPTIAVRRHAFGFERLPARGGDRADACPSDRARQFAQRRAATCPPAGVTGLPAGLSASTLPSRASSVARRGSVVLRLSSSPGRRPGEGERARPGDAGAFAAGFADLQREGERQRAEQAGVARAPGPPRGRPGRRGACPSTRRPVAVAVRSALLVGAGEFASTRSSAARRASMSAYIVA